MSKVLGFKAILKICLFVVFIAIILSVIYNERNKNNSIYTDYYSQIRSQFTSNSKIMNFFKSSSAKDEAWPKAQNVYEFSVKNIDQEDVSLEKYRGKVLLIVNVASNCGFTKRNYQELNELYDTYKDQGLAIIGFPCNQFAGQEPGCETDIKEFIKKNHVEWDMYAKVDVNGDKAIPLYKWLKTKEHGLFLDAIKWNFTKFLVNKQGVPVARFAPNKNPKEFENEIRAELGK